MATFDLNLIPLEEDGEENLMARGLDLNQPYEADIEGDRTNVEGLFDLNVVYGEGGEDEDAVVAEINQEGEDAVINQEDENEEGPFDLNVMLDQEDENEEIYQGEEDAMVPGLNQQDEEEFETVGDDEEDEDIFENAQQIPDIDNVVVHNNAKRKFVCNKQRNLIYSALLERSVGGKLKKNTTHEVAQLFSVNIQSVQRIWKRAKETINGVVDVSHRRTKNCGRKRVEIDLSKIQDIPLHRRTTVRSLASSSSVDPSTLFRRVKEGSIRRHSNAIKPHLKEENKLQRLRFCLSMLDATTMQSEPKFVAMHNVVNIDEKWFFMTKRSENYYLLPEEEEPVRMCQSKNFIGKVMFLAAMARPRFDADGNGIFSGKIGIFPFVTEKPAERRSRNRDAGTMELKPMTSINRYTIRTFMIEKVISAIKRNWPRDDLGTTIYIQQDNARTHIDPSDELFRSATNSEGFDIQLTCQPSNSPDLNILDLGFFSSIQALQQKECPRTVPELLATVQKSFDEYPAFKLNRVFVTLQLCMREIMKSGGSNKYKTPHVNKSRMEREGQLHIQVSCEQEVIQNVMNLLA